MAALQLYPHGNAPNYYPSSMVYYPQPSFQPSSEYSYGQSVPLHLQQADMLDSSFLTMHPSMVHEQQPVYYTVDGNGSFILLNGHLQPFNASPALSLNQSDVSSNESFHRPSIGSTSDGTIASQRSEIKSSSSAKCYGSMKSSDGGMNRKASGGKPRLNVSSAYKTQLCNMFHSQGACSYGARCQYAHGLQEIRPITPHPKYKTLLCNKFSTPRGCQYGEKCHYRHPSDPVAAMYATADSNNNQSG